MTPTQQNEAIAKWMGWEPQNTDFSGISSGKVTVFKQWRRPDGVRDQLPDYVNDLNALNLVEAKLSHEQFLNYVDALCRAVAEKPGSKFDDDTGWAPAMVHATAAVKAECILRTLNLWTD